MQAGLQTRSNESMMMFIMFRLKCRPFLTTSLMMSCKSLLMTSSTRCKMRPRSSESPPNKALIQIEPIALNHQLVAMWSKCRGSLPQSPQKCVLVTLLLPAPNLRDWSPSSKAHLRWRTAKTGGAGCRRRIYRACHPWRVTSHAKLPTTPTRCSTSQTRPATVSKVESRPSVRR